MEMRAFSQVLAYTEHWLHLMSHVGLLKSSLRRAAAGVKKCFPPRMYVSVPAHPAAWWAAVMDPIILDVTGHLCQQQSQYVPFTYGFWPQLPHPKRFSELVPPMHRTTCLPQHHRMGPVRQSELFFLKQIFLFHYLQNIVLAIGLPNPQAPSKYVWHSKYMEEVLTVGLCWLKLTASVYTKWQRAEGAELSPDPDGSNYAL